MSILARPSFNLPHRLTRRRRNILKTNNGRDGRDGRRNQAYEEGVGEEIIDEGIIVWRRSVVYDEDDENHDEFLTERREHREEGEAPNR